MIKILLLTISFFLPFFIRKKNYDFVILRFDNDRFMFNTKVFFEYLLEKSNLKAKYIINDDRLRRILIEKYGEHFITQKTIKDIIFISKAGSWITDGGFPLKTPFGHKNRVLINLWHGMPMKHIGIKGYSGISKIRVWIQLKMFAPHYNAFCVVSSKMQDIIEESFLIDKNKIKILGQPRNDLLFKVNDRNKILEGLYQNTLPKYKKIVLYAPTYRSSKYGTSSMESTKYFPFDDFDIGHLEKFLDDEKIIIFIRSHHLDKINFKECSRIRFLNNDKVNEISDILNIFDMLISDYSGMIFDFLLLNKPLLLLPYDMEEYIKKVGMYFDYSEVSPAPSPVNQKDFIRDIKNLLTTDNIYRKDRQALKEEIFEVTKDNNMRILSFLEKEIKGYINE